MSTPATANPGTPDPLTPDPLAPATLGPITLRNRIIKAATFEGVTRGALASDELIAFHREVGAGGAAMTTVAYLAVSPEGRTSRHQIYWRPEALPGLRALTDAVHSTGAKVSAQIGHAGPVANARSNRAPALAPSQRFNIQSMSVDQAATRDDIARIIVQFGQAAKMAVDVGFDCIEVHSGHNYLTSSFLSPKLNKRRDAFGGSLAGRARLARDILAEVRENAGDGVAVITKLNMDDGVRGGFWVDEATAVAQMIEADGTVDAIELTAGSSLHNPMYLFRGDVPLDAFAATQPQPFKAGVHIVGRSLFKHYPYRPLYLLELARSVRRQVNLPLVLLGGITEYAHMVTAMEEGFQFVAMGRALLREPNLIHRIAEARDTASACIHCNLCMPSIYSRTRCPLRVVDGNAQPLAG